MFTLFFNPAEVTNLAVATQSDTKRFARYFHAMLERGIYLACSQYEANFISAMHTQEDIQRTLDAARQSFELISQS
jgi:glutamate-1-semialdehyde 2,1-aminomutase